MLVPISIRLLPKTISLKRVDKIYGRDATWLRCSPASIRPSLLQCYFFDPRDPAVRLEVPRSERRDHLEHMIGESPDVQDVRAFGSLRRLVRLDVQTNQ